MSATWDYTIVGAGIVGLAVARALQQREPRASVLVVEKEMSVAAHQTGHNSGVIHAGIYYEPGTLKARLCRAGLERTIAYCREHDIAYTQCGKLIVAVDAIEMQRLRALYERAEANGVPVAWLGAAELREREPAVTGLGALLASETGIVDYPGMCRSLAAGIASHGEIRHGVEVQAIREETGTVHLETTAATVATRRLVVCGGLQADRLLRASGQPVDFAIVPFRGDYFALPASRRDLVKHLIYPVPDPVLPFLGIHLTRMINGSITVGPSAMLAFARERYTRTAVDVRDLVDAFRFPGTWRVLARYPAAGLKELGYALSPARYLQAVQRYCPSLTLADLRPYQSGIRAQAVSADGRLIHDFLLRRTPRTLHVCNAPSPAATAALPIADEIVARLCGPV
ncbi:MAG: L-2-hydroxyglutarate oxidase [Gammaproteobacteria bacterium]|nr:L-2-hydroxyglutarate oxidase [Gammaproteobacteria bacterium]